MSLVGMKRKGPPRKWNQLHHYVDPKAIERYIRGPFKDHDYVKDLERGEILRTTPSFKMYTKPRNHQYQMWYLTTYYRNLLLYTPMGSGKTKVILDTIRFRKRFHGLRGTIVFTLNLISAKTWQDEAALHAPDLKCEILDGTRLERIKKIEESTADVIVTNYHSLPMLLCDSVETAKVKGARNKKYKWVYNRRYLKRVIPKFNALVIDEIHMLGGYDGLWWRLADHIGQVVRYRYALTGTAFSKDPLPIFSQFKLIDHGETFGRTVGMFRTAFYDFKKGYFGGKWKFNDQMSPDLNRMIANRAISYKFEEFTDLPPMTVQDIVCKQSVAMLEMYTRLVNQILQTNDYALLKAKFVQLRQCTSGYQTVIERQSLEEQQLELLNLKAKPKRAYIEFTRNPKLEALMQLLDGLPVTEKVIVFCEYRHTVVMISERLDAASIKQVKLYGGNPDNIGSLDRFYRDPMVRVAVANNITASMSINPQHVCRYGIFFENSVRPSIRQQAERRLHRPGQERPVFMYNILVANSIDQRIMGWIREGKNLLQQLLHKGAQRDLF